MWRLWWRFDLPVLIQPVPASHWCCLDLAVMPPLSRSTSCWLEGCLLGDAQALAGCAARRVCRPGSCVPARRHLPLNMGVPQTGATTDEMANQNKLSGAAAGGFLIQQAGWHNLERNIQLRRGCILYLKDGIFLKVLIWLSVYPCLNPEEKQSLLQCYILSGIPLLICHTAPGTVTMKIYECSVPLAKGAKDDCVSVLS